MAQSPQTGLKASSSFSQGPLKTAQRMKFGRYTLDPEQRVLFRGEERVSASPKVLETLEILVSAEGRVVSKESLMQAHWPDTFVEDGNLTQNIFILRKLLGQSEQGKPYIETIPKRGYRISVPVQLAGETGQSFSPLHPSLQAEDEPENGDAAVAASDLHSEPPIVSSDQLSVASEHPVPAQAGVHGPTWRLMAVLLLAGCSALGFFFMHRTPRTLVSLTESRRLTDDGQIKNLGPFPSALATDGKNIYFTERRDNKTVIAWAPIEGGDVKYLSSPSPDSAVADYSNVNHSLLVGSIWHTTDDAPILVQPSGASAFRQLGELRGHDAAWSPDAQRVAFANGRFLFVANTDGSGVHQIAAANGVVYWPRWSPNGTSLRFSVNLGSNEVQIWGIDADGQHLRQLYANESLGSQICCGSWAARDGSYFFLKTGPAGAEVVMIPSHSHWWEREPQEPIKISIGAVDNVRGLLPDPDGSRFWVIGSHLRGQLTRIDPATRQAEPFLKGMSAEGVSFSPNARWIAYTEYPEGTLWRSRIDGTDKLQITRTPMVARFPRWSPDGKTIAFLAGLPGSKWRIYLASATSGEVRPLLGDEGGAEGVASWSPDGRQIAFGRLLDYGTERNPNLNVQIYDFAQKKRTTLHDSTGLWTPRWSPDGRYLTAVSEDNRVLRLFDCKTEQWSDLSRATVNDVVWTPDSQFVFFDTALGSDPGLYRVRIADRKVELWSSLRGFRRGGFFNPWVGISPDGAPLLLRDNAIEEVYQVNIEINH